MLPNYLPGFVEAVTDNRERREIRVSFAPYTDGASEWPIAEMSYPMGDDSRGTEIRIVPGMPVWLAFRGGDERYPIIVGNRPVNTGNEQSTRRWNHDNFEFNADKDFTVNAGQHITITAAASITLAVGGTSLKLTPETIAKIAAAHNIKGPVTQTGGDITSDGISVQEHPHRDSMNGQTSPPLPS
ncbi:hypothetical protein KVG88_30410 [Pseudomonas sp. SWRI74]|uniref:Gp5/Type VI secretion system Vgr protein OB-fold domain-containing protein n=1 Tax=Pseudomonas azerbaijanoccidentalis TaxID=2842347 RepID=A0ABS6QZM9_9PSED|nr:phage baseplate assembly protein V [Pseudomonas azerbaijanoccidentalis]MBV4524390.1 hypothetical protein [Pseudomonas azerbaijanoccidentalis]